jgi:protease I
METLRQGGQVSGPMCRSTKPMPNPSMPCCFPAGVANPDQLRTLPQAAAFARSFFDTGKPVAAICHGPWTLVEADVASGRTLTSWPSLKTHLKNAGAHWVDREVVVDDGLVSSRKPDDIRLSIAR